jgi:hypothetical protein
MKNLKLYTKLTNLNLNLFTFSKADIVIQIFGTVIDSIFIDVLFLQSSGFGNTHSLFFSNLAPNYNAITSFI